MGDSMISELQSQTIVGKRTDRPKATLPETKHSPAGGLPAVQRKTVGQSGGGKLFASRAAIPN